MIDFERNLILFDCLVMKRLLRHLAESYFADYTRCLEFLFLSLPRRHLNGSEPRRRKFWRDI